MSEQEFVLRPPNGSSPVVVRSEDRRDALLGRGYTLIERSNPAPKPKTGQKRRTAPKPKE